MIGEQNESTERLMRRIAGGLVSWLTYQQVALRSPMYSERFVYTPIFELASARHWKANPEFSVKLDDEESKKRLDFVFSSGGKKRDKKDKVAALEIKYISDKRRKTDIENVIKDEQRLKKFQDNHFQNGVHLPADRYIILVGKEGAVRWLCETAYNTRKKRENKSSLMKRAHEIMESPNGQSRKGEHFGRVYYSSIDFRASEKEGGHHNRWTVMVLLVPSE